MSLKQIVGEKTYSVWVEMLRQLVPHGRTQMKQLYFKTSAEWQDWLQDLELLEKGQKLGLR